MDGRDVELELLIMSESLKRFALQTGSDDFALGCDELRIVAGAGYKSNYCLLCF